MSRGDDSAVHLPKKSQAYDFFKEDISEKNYNMLLYFSGGSTIISVMVWTASSLFHIFDRYSSLIYLAWALMSVAAYLLCRLKKEAVLRRATAFLYIYTSMMFLSAIISGTVLYRNSISGTVIGAIALLPFILFDIPWRFCVYECCICAVFCLLSCLVKPGPIARVDCLNAVGFTFISCLMGARTMQLKLSDIRSRFLITVQRDTDQLTGLSARIAAEQAINVYCAESRQPAVLFLIDIDHFKAINDTFGHRKGDDVLIAVAREIRRCFREGDCVARLGGDEFIVFAYGCSDREWICKKAEALNRAIAQKVEYGGQSCEVSASIGISLYDGGQAFETLYARADEMLYEVKERGRNGYQIYGER